MTGLRILERSIELTVKSNQSNTEVACLRNQLTQVKLPMTEVNNRHGPRLNAQVFSSTVAGVQREMAEQNI